MPARSLPSVPNLRSLSAPSELFLACGVISDGFLDCFGLESPSQALHTLLQCLHPMAPKCPAWKHIPECACIPGFHMYLLAWLSNLLGQDRNILLCTHPLRLGHMILCRDTPPQLNVLLFLSHQAVHGVFILSKQVIGSIIFHAYLGQKLLFSVNFASCFWNSKLKCLITWWNERNGKVLFLLRVLKSHLETENLGICT